MRRVASLLCVGACACEPTVVVGTRVCQQAPDAALTQSGDAAAGGGTVTVPWSTGFEDGFCDFAPPVGFCVTSGDGSYSLVTSPVHSGRYAAAFSVNSAIDGGSQARCVRQGTFPAAAYYGAWYYLPGPAVAQGNWNLFHYQGPTPEDGGGPPYLWDVSLQSADDAGLQPYLRDFLTQPNQTVNAPSTPMPVPIGQWFHLEWYFKRASDTTGEVSLWLNESRVVDVPGIVTDDTDGGQWFVGNLTSFGGIVPPASVVYVDDITIGSTM
jgi:hypothetical protein